MASTRAFRVLGRRPVTEQVPSPPATKLAAEIDPQRKPPVRRSIRDNVGYSRPATALDPLLDHFISGRQQRFRDGKAECLGGFEVDEQLELGRQLNG